MTTSRAGAVTGRISWMNDVLLVDVQHHLAGREIGEAERCRPAPVTAASDAVLRDGPDVHSFHARAAARRRGPLISTPGSSDTSTGFVVASPSCRARVFAE